MNTTIKSTLTATALAALLATAAVAQDSATSPTDAPEQDTMQGNMMPGDMKDGQMMGGDMKGMMQMMENCNEMMQVMTEHMKSHAEAGSEG
jgi:hypothetical protein